MNTNAQKKVNLIIQEEVNRLVRLKYPNAKEGEEFFVKMASYGKRVTLKVYTKEDYDKLMEDKK